MPMSKKKKKTGTPYGLPSKVTIFSHEWDVEYVDIVDKGEHLLGACIAKDRLILIDKDQSEGCMIETLVHEIMHAYAAILPSNMDEEMEEQIVQLATSWFIDFTRNHEDFWS